MDAFIEIHQGRIRLSTESFDPNVLAKAKSIAGARALFKSNRFVCWTFPLNFPTCLELREQFGSSLKIGSQLSAWARVEKARRRQVIDVAKKTSYELSKVKEVSPQLYEALSYRTYQQVDARFIVQARRVLNANDPGLGKTAETIAALVEAEIVGPILVAGPSGAARIVWPEELDKWLPNDFYWVVDGPKQKRQKIIDEWLDFCSLNPDQRCWLLVNYEVLRASKKRTKMVPSPSSLKWETTINGNRQKGFWHHPFPELFDVQYSAIIADEIHKALITRTPIVTKMEPLHRAGLALLSVKDGGLKVAFSGTPQRGKRENLWGTLNWLYPETYKSYWQWCQTYFDTFENGYSLEIGDIKPEKEKALHKELDPIMIRRTKAEVLPELPPKLYAGRPLDPNSSDSAVGHWLEMSEPQAKMYEEMRQFGESRLNSGIIMGNGVLSEMTRLKQFACSSGDLWFETCYNDDGEEFQKVHYTPQLPSNKFQWLLHRLEELGIGSSSGNEKIVIASQFTKIIYLYAQELVSLGVPCFTFTGKTKDSDRRERKNKFQNENKVRVMLINSASGGTALTLDAADNLVILDETWDPDTQTQVEDRIHRTSRMHQVIIDYVRSLGTIEESIARNNETADMLQRKMLDGRRGVDFTKKLIGTSGVKHGK